MNNIKLTLVDRNTHIVQAWLQYFSDLPNVTMINDQFQNHSAHVVVSPANSFGFMNGGIDYWYSQLFGQQIQDRVQEVIKRDYDGELLVGQAFMVETGHQQFPELICAPTMRLPMRIMDPADVFLATRAALRLVKNFDNCTIMFPGMGTGAGAIEPEMCAVHMRKAYNAVFVGEQFPDSWEQGLQTTYGPLT
jgi:O-acetyl-ADP-ribose deacetylase (regulator of RNase III)